MGYLQLASALGTGGGTGETSSSLTTVLLAVALVVCSYVLAVVIRAPSVDTIRRHGESRRRARDHAR